MKQNLLPLGLCSVGTSEENLPSDPPPWERPALLSVLPLCGGLTFLGLAGLTLSILKFAVASVSRLLPSYTRLKVLNG